MVSPDDPEATADAATPAGASRPRLPVERVELPVYRPRRRGIVLPLLVFLVAAALAAVIVWLLLS